MKKGTDVLFSRPFLLQYTFSMRSLILRLKAEYPGHKERAGEPSPYKWFRCGYYLMTSSIGLAVDLISGL